MKTYSCHICKNKLSIILDLNKQPLVNSIFIKKNFVYNSFRYKNHFFKLEIRMKNSQSFKTFRKSRFLKFFFLILY